MSLAQVPTWAAQPKLAPPSSAPAQPRQLAYQSRPEHSLGLIWPNIGSALLPHTQTHLSPSLPLTTTITTITTIAVITTSFAAVHHHQPSPPPRPHQHLSTAFTAPPPINAHQPTIQRQIYTLGIRTSTTTIGQITVASPPKGLKSHWHAVVQQGHSPNKII